MRLTSCSLQCTLIAALAVVRCFGASVHLRATVGKAAVSRHGSQDEPGGGCRFVSHRPDDSEMVLAVEGPQVLFRKGNVAVVEQKPMRYLVSLASDGSCNEQAEQMCSSSDTSDSSNSTAASCDSSPCTPAGNGDTLLSYLRSMAGGALALRPHPGRSVVIGLGSGALPAWLGQAFPGGSVDSVDLDADVVAAAQCFGVRESAQLHVIESEGRQFLSSASSFAYDAIFLDAFDPAGSMPGCLATVEFFEMVAQKLSPDQGVLSVNLGFRDGEAGPVLAALQKVFMHVAVGHAPHLTNRLALASQNELSFPTGDAGSAELLAPGSVAANLTRWSRQANFQISKHGSVLDEPRTDATEGCTAARTSN